MFHFIGPVIKILCLANSSKKYKFYFVQIALQAAGFLYRGCVLTLF